MFSLSKENFLQRKKHSWIAKVLIIVTKIARISHFNLTRKDQFNRVLSNRKNHNNSKKIFNQIKLAKRRK